MTRHALRSRSAQLTPQRAGKHSRARWWYTILLTVITVILLIPVVAVVLLAFEPQVGGTTTAGFTVANFTSIFTQTSVFRWLANSLIVTFSTMIISVIVAIPAGYVLSRSRSRAVTGYSMLLFIIQSMPVIVAVIPLFVLFARLHLINNLVGLAVIYVGTAISVATWMMAAYFHTIPLAMEEAAWIDGASITSGLIKIVLPNSLPGILSTAIFSFLIAWNDYLVAVVFLRDNSTYTLPVGIETFFAQYSTAWGSVMAISVVMMLPPIIIFTTLHRYFSVGGIGGALAGQ